VIAFRFRILRRVGGNDACRDRPDLKPGAGLAVDGDQIRLDFVRQVLEDDHRWAGRQIDRHRSGDTGAGRKTTTKFDRGRRPELVGRGGHDERHRQRDAGSDAGHEILPIVPSWTDITYECIIFGSRLNCGECLAANVARMTNDVILAT
jgi:hypothetical protein